MYIKLHGKKDWYLHVNKRGQYFFTKKEFATNFIDNNYFRYVLDDVSIQFRNDWFSVEV